MTIQMITIIMMMKMTPPLRQSLSEVQTIGSPLVKVVPLALPDQDDHGDVDDDDGVDDDHVYDDDDDTDDGGVHSKNAIGMEKQSWEMPQVLYLKI